MDFLMIAFRRVLEGYKLNFTLERKGSGYSLDLRDLPPELDYKLIRLEYQTPSKEVRKILKGRELVDVTYEYETFHVCNPIRNNGINSIHVDLYEDNYAIKMNKIDVVLREYYSGTHKNYV